MSVDVIVLGAGLAGLNAARRLKERGASVQVVEARDRVGGRTWSEEIGGAVFDRGGQWVGPNQTRVLGLAEELGIGLSPTPIEGTKVLELDGKLSTYRSDIPSLSMAGLMAMQLAVWKLDRWRKEIPLEAPWTARRAREWDHINVEAFSRDIESKQVRAMLEIMTRSVWSAEPHEMSLLYFLFYIHAAGGLDPVANAHNGAQQWRMVGGAQGLSRGLAQRIGDVITFEAPVRRVVQGPGEVRVLTDRGEFASRYLICAVPPTLAGRIEWQPGMPPRRDQLTQRTPMGYTIKVLCLYERPWWRDKGYSGEALSNSGPVAFTYDNPSADGKRSAMVAFVAGDAARRLGEIPAEERKEEIVRALVRLHGPQAREMTDYVEQNWSMEPWSGGCPVGMGLPGVLSSLGSALREPVGRIHFAGTETATRWCGYMDGALQSGERAADEILGRL